LCTLVQSGVYGTYIPLMKVVGVFGCVFIAPASIRKLILIKSKYAADKLEMYA
jgi:hypothetical protein